MLRHRLALSVTKWTGAGACLLIIAAWAFSIVWCVNVWSKTIAGVLVDGEVQVFGFTSFPKVMPTWTIQRVSDLRPQSGRSRHGLTFGQWNSRGGRASVQQWRFVVPLWYLLVLAVIPTVYLFRRAGKFVLPDHCRACGYNLTGNVSGICPECGTGCPPPVVDGRP